MKITFVKKSLIAIICIFNFQHQYAFGEEVKFDASYVATIAGIRIGKGYFSSKFNDGAYAATVFATTDSIGKWVSSGKGEAKAQGYLSKTKPLPQTYTLEGSEGEKTNLVKMDMIRGNIRSLSAEPPLEPHPQRVEVKAIHKKGIVDPVSALIMPVKNAEAAEGPEACNRTIAIFDGRQRYDVKLSYARTETIEDSSYAGKTIVCQANYRPIAGHRETRRVNKELQQNQDLFIWLAPIGKTGVVVPWKMEIGLKYGQLVIQAKSFSATGETGTIAVR
jgi:hypothetical protein